MDADSLLDDMIDADGQLYERILDTPGFALAFNRLAKLAHDRDALLAVAKKLLWNFPDLDEVLGGQSVQEARDLIRDARAAIAAAESPQ